MAAPGQEYRVMVTSAVVAETRDVAGTPKPWDAVGRPDPYVVVELAGKPVFVSGKQQDTLTPRWFTGTSAWKIDTSTPVRIILRDADLAKGLARIGVAGISLRPDVPNAGKRLVNDVLLGVESDDVIAIWRGSLGQLIAALGGVNRTGTLSGAPGPGSHFETNAGLRSLAVRVVARPASPVKGATTHCLGFADARFEPRKRGPNLPWDAGLGAVQNPDPRYLVYVNGEPVMAGAANQDTLVASWPGKLPALDLRDDDIVALALFDADAGTRLAGGARHALLFSPALSPDAKDTLFEELARASTDDLVYLWVGSWRSLAARGPRFAAPRGADPGIWVNRGLERATVLTANATASVGGAPLSLVIEGVTLQPTRADGKTWDFGKGAPDPLVKCFVADPRGGWTLVGATDPMKDTTRATWNFPITDARLVPGRKLRLEVYDKDGASDDLAGTLLVTIPTEPGRVVQRGGQVTALTLRFK
jgi:hypothetical protein